MKLSRAITSTLANSILALTASQAHAETISIEFTNLTHGNYFTPLLFAAHSSGTHLFEVGSEASAELQAMAEGGSIDGLVTISTSIGAEVSANPAEGLLEPGESVSIGNWNTGDNTQLTVTGMILPTNDAFVGLDAWTIPNTSGSYTVYLNAYDAGTEANDEIVNGGGATGTPGIPANPGMNGGENATGVTTTETNNYIHIHRGVIGDTNAEGGVSDLDSRIHRWLNPVAKLVVIVE